MKLAFLDESNGYMRSDVCTSGKSFLVVDYLFMLSPFRSQNGEEVPHV